MTNKETVLSILPGAKSERVEGNDGGTFTRIISNNQVIGQASTPNKAWQVAAAYVQREDATPAPESFKVDRFEDGTPRRFTDIGGYPLYYVTNAGGVLCPVCAGAEESPDNDDPVVASDANWEDPSLYCDGCSKRIESAYAEDESETPEPTPQAPCGWCGSTDDYHSPCVEADDTPTPTAPVAPPERASKHTAHRPRHVAPKVKNHRRKRNKMARNARKRNR